MWLFIIRYTDCNLLGGEDISEADLLKLFSEDFTPKKPVPSSSSTPACNNKEVTFCLYLKINIYKCFHG